MKNYNSKAIKEFNHPTPTKPVHGPSIFKKPEYGKKVQYAFVDQSEKLTPKETIQIQRIAGNFLYSSRAIDNTIMHALNEINIEATKAT